MSLAIDKRRQRRMDKVAQRSIKSIDEVLIAAKSGDANVHELAISLGDTDAVAPAVLGTDHLETLDDDEDKTCNSKILTQPTTIELTLNNDAVELPVEEDADDIKRALALKKEVNWTKTLRSGKGKSKANDPFTQLLSLHDQELKNIDSHQLISVYNIGLACGSMFMFSFRVLYASFFKYFHYRIKFVNGEMIANRNVFNNLSIQRKFIVALLAISLSFIVAWSSVSPTCRYALSDESPYSLKNHLPDAPNYNIIIDNILNLGLSNDCLTLPNLIFYFIIAEVPLTVLSYRDSLTPTANINQNIDDAMTIQGAENSTPGPFGMIGNMSSPIMFGVNLVKGFIPPPIIAGYTELNHLKTDFAIYLFIFTVTLCVSTFLIY